MLKLVRRLVETAWLRAHKPRHHPCWFSVAVPPAGDQPSPLSGPLTRRTRELGRSGLPRIPWEIPARLPSSRPLPRPQPSLRSRGRRHLQGRMHLSSGAVKSYLEQSNSGVRRHRHATPAGSFTSRWMLSLARWTPPGRTFLVEGSQLSVSPLCSHLRACSAGWQVPGETDLLTGNSRPTLVQSL